MSSRAQQLVVGLGVDKQADISTASTTFRRWRKLDTGITSPTPVNEDDASETGKPDEFAEDLYASYYDAKNRLEKYASAQFLLWAIGFGLGNVSVTPNSGSTVNATGTTTSGSPNLTAMSSISGIVAGMTVTGTGIANGTTVVSASGTTVVMSANATSTNAAEALTFTQAAGSGFSYTIVPIDPGTTLELPYFSVCEQMAEGGGMSIDNLFIGCAIEDWTYSWNYGPGRASSKITASWIGSGLLNAPSGVTVPALQPETNILAAGMSCTWNGVDYVASGRMVSGTIAWKNNLMEKQGFFPGSGQQNGYQVRGRLEIGDRSQNLGVQWTVRLLKNSPEYAALIARTTAPFVLTIPHDANSTVTFTFPKMALKVSQPGDSDGIVTLNITGIPMRDPDTGVVLTVTGNCDLGGIAQ